MQVSRRRFGKESKWELEALKDSVQSTGPLVKGGVCAAWPASSPLMWCAVCVCVNGDGDF